MELTHLKYFYEVAKQGSFTRASKSLRITQPSISKTIQQMEYTTGQRLLDRARRGGVSLTPAGKILYQSCEKIFLELEAMRIKIELESRECAGPVSIGASDNLCNHFLPKVLAKFCKDHPKVRVSLLSGSSSSI